MSKLMSLYHRIRFLLWDAREHLMVREVQRLLSRTGTVYVHASEETAPFAVITLIGNMPPVADDADHDHIEGKWSW